MLEWGRVHACSAMKPRKRLAEVVGEIVVEHQESFRAWYTEAPTNVFYEGAFREFNGM